MSMHYLVYYGIICWLLLVPIQAQQSENTSHQKSSEAEARISPPAPSPANNANVKEPEGPIQETKPSENETDRGGQRVTRAEWMQIGINGLLFVVVLWQTLIYIQQRNTMRQQVALARIAERAYIGIERVVTEFHTVGQQPVVRITVVNAGRTPAYGLRLPAHLTHTRAGQPYPHERPEFTNKPSESFLPAGSPTTFSLPFPPPLTPWTAELAKSIATKEYFLYVHVEAQFDDVWGDKHVQPFKLFYRVSDKRWAEYKDPKDAEPVVEIT
jgi:hypothetical protein